jgi:hypothetical protein
MLDPPPVPGSPLVVGNELVEPLPPLSLDPLPTEVSMVVPWVAVEPLESPHATSTMARGARTCEAKARE